MNQEMDMKKRESEPTTVERTHSRPTFIPATDIYETENTLVVVADMPGVDDKSIDIQLEKGILKITGHVEPPQIAEGYRPSYWEYQVGDYERSFTVSDEIDSDKIEASIKDGVLKLQLPKSEKLKPRKIPVKSA
jgi:HSP20 family molecular chaperone IbpA